MTHPSFRLTVIAAALSGLSACIGTDNPDFNQQAIDGAQLIGSFQGRQLTPLADMPGTGRATYTGVAGFNLDQPGSTLNPFELLADLEVVSDFDTNEVTGDLSSFNTPDGPGTGTIPLTNGEIVGNALVMDANGQIGLPDGDSMAINADLAGVFRGNGAAVVVGSGDGSYTMQNSGDTGELFVQFGAD